MKKLSKAIAGIDKDDLFEKKRKPIRKMFSIDEAVFERLEKFCKKNQMFYSRFTENVLKNVLDEVEKL
jgi:hypothetical protein